MSHSCTPINWSQHSIRGLPGAYYVPNFLDAEGAEKLVREVFNNSLVKLRLENPSYPAPTMVGFDDGENPPFVEDFVKRMLDVGVIDKRPFQININIYDPPAYAIVPHKDTLGNCVVIISLLSTTMLDFYACDCPTYNALLFESDIGEPSISLALEPDSLLKLTNESFHKHMHGIYPRTKDTITSNLGNVSYLTSVHPGDVIERKQRIAIILWTI